MRKFQVLFGLAIALVIANVATANLTSVGSSSTANQVTLIYDQASGNLSMDSGGTLVTTFELVSASNQFIPGGITPGLLLPPFDLITPAKVFKLSTDGIGNTDFGAILPAGLDEAALLPDLVLDGSLAPSGGIDQNGGPNLFVIPEPSSLGLLGLGLLGLLGIRRKRS